MLGRNRMSMYGPRTAHAFGHLGFTATLAWADPERDVAACLMTSGKTCVAPGWLDWYEVLSRIARHCKPYDSGR
jgi:CubicO group peptidase (beta-lactamase class C family)